MYIGRHVKYRFLFSDFSEASIFSTAFRKITSDFMKFLPVGTEFFHAERRMDRRTDGRDESRTCVIPVVSV